MISTNLVRIENIVPAGVDPANIHIDVLRLDLIHNVISGNKWFKLHRYLEEARQLQKKHILTWGGAWSNHILAAAAACKEMNFSLTVLVRGEKTGELTPTLQQVISYGAEIFFVDRYNYREKIIPPFLDAGTYHMIPEGGKGEAGVAGAAEISDLCAYGQYSHILCAAGTGTMSAGLLRRTHPHQQLLGVSVLRGYPALESEIIAMAGAGRGRLKVIHDFHFGGYAGTTPELFQFMNTLYAHSGIPTDFVYTAKLFYALFHLLKKEYFPGGSRILVVHSGGLQGNASVDKGTLIF